jgi:hypothetical protein
MARLSRAAVINPKRDRSLIEVSAMFSPLVGRFVGLRNPIMAVLVGIMLIAGMNRAVNAAPLLTMQYVIGSESGTLQFMPDLQVFACDGSVLVACDGSVQPIADVTFRTLGDGSVRDLTPIALLADGSVRALGGAESTTAEGIYLNSLNFSPNPLLSVSIAAVDVGDPSTFVLSFIGSLSLGGNTYAYDLTGTAELRDAGQDGISMTTTTLFGLDGLVAGAVDGSGIAAIGETISAAGTFTLPGTSGIGGCAACTSFGISLGFTGSGNGDTYTITSVFDLTPVPTPAPLGLLVAGALGLFGLRARALQGN